MCVCKFEVTNNNKNSSTKINSRKKIRRNKKQLKIIIIIVIIVRKNKIGFAYRFTFISNELTVSCCRFTFLLFFLFNNKMVLHDFKHNYCFHVDLLCFFIRTLEIVRLGNCYSPLLRFLVNCANSVSCRTVKLNRFSFFCIAVSLF